MWGYMYWKWMGVLLQGEGILYSTSFCRELRRGIFMLAVSEPPAFDEMR
jgi:hypothetical protein